MRTVTICLTAFGVLSMWNDVGHAQSFATCLKIGDKEARLSCYDAIAAADSTAPKRESIVTTAEVVGPSAPASFSAADLRQLAREPQRYVNKPLVFGRMRCIYSNVNDYRCRPASGEKLEVRSPIIVPPPAQTAIEAQCGTLYESRALPCAASVRVITTSVKPEAGGWLLVEAPSMTLKLAGRVSSHGPAQALSGRRSRRPTHRGASSLPAGRQLAL